MSTTRRAEMAVCWSGLKAIEEAGKIVKEEKP